MQDRATWHDFSPGPIQQTGNPLDVAIDGNAFLVVQTPRGERYTRNGALQINATGELVTSTGDRVLGDGGPIQFQTTDHDISINPRRHHHGARRRQYDIGFGARQAAPGALRQRPAAAEGRIEPVRRAERRNARSRHQRTCA